MEIQYPLSQSERYFIETTFPLEAKEIIKELEKVPGKCMADKLKKKKASAIFPGIPIKASRNLDGK